MEKQTILDRHSLEMKAAARIELLRRGTKGGDFWSYCLYWDYKFYSRRPFLKDIAVILQRVYDSYKNEEVIRVAISLPPRSGKSYCVSMFCAFMLGHFPDKSIMRNTCTSTLYEKLSKDVREMVQSDKWFGLFGVRLRTKGVKTWALETATQSSYFGGGTGGTIIGIGASMLDISDDLYRGITDALSESVNQKTIEWSESARGSRVERGCCQIDVGTRWRTNDIIGINEARGDYKKENIIKVSALTKKNKSFCEDVQSTEHYLDVKNKIAEPIWFAEYQQEPIDIKGRLFDHDDLKWYDGKLPIDSMDSNLGVCDVADEGHDYLSAPFAKKYGDLYYIYDWIFTDQPVEVTSPLLKGVLDENNVNLMRFESNNGGRIFALEIAKDVETNVTWQFTTSNKETRIFTDSAWIKNHCVFRNDVKPGSQYDRALQQLLTYLAKVEKQKDDAPDSLSMLRRFTDEMGFNNKTVESKSGRSNWESIEIGINQINI